MILHRWPTWLGQAMSLASGTEPQVAAAIAVQAAAHRVRPRLGTKGTGSGHAVTAVNETSTPGIPAK